MSRPSFLPFGKLALVLVAIALTFSSCNYLNKKTTDNNEESSSKKSDKNTKNSDDSIEESDLNSREKPPYSEDNVERFKDAAMDLGETYLTLRNEFDYWPECGLRITGGHLASLISLKEFEDMLPCPLYVSGPHRNGRWNLNSYEFGHYNPEAIQYLGDLAKEVVADRTFIRRSKPLVDRYLYDKMLIMMVIHDALYDRSLPSMMYADQNTKRLREEIFNEIIENQGYCEDVSCFFLNTIYIDVDSWTSNSSTEHFLYFWARRWKDGTIDLFYDVLSTVFYAYYPNYQFNTEDYYMAGEEMYDEEWDDDYYDSYDDEVFTIVEEMPEFPGGMEKLSEYLANNIQYPQTALDSGIQGRVFIYFIVESDGSVSNVQVLRGIGGGCDEEAVRVVENMPKWKPGKQRGKAVRVSYNLPVSFKLQ